MKVFIVIHVPTNEIQGIYSSVEQAEKIMLEYINELIEFGDPEEDYSGDYTIYLDEVQ